MVLWYGNKIYIYMDMFEDEMNSFRYFARFEIQGVQLKFCYIYIIVL